MPARRLRLLLCALAALWATFSLYMLTQDNVVAGLAGLVLAAAAGAGALLLRKPGTGRGATRRTDREAAQAERGKGPLPRGLGFAEQDRNTHKMSVVGMTFALLVIIGASVAVMLTPGVTPGQRLTTLLIAGAMAALAAGFLLHSLRKLRS